MAVEGKLYLLKIYFDKSVLVQNLYTPIDTKEPSTATSHINIDLKSVA